MENTEQLRLWIHRKVESDYNGNLTSFSEHTGVSRQTWMNILNSRYRSLRQQAINDLCTLFGLTEVELYRIAHPETASDGAIREASAAYRPGDEAARLAGFLRKANKRDRDFIFEAAERCGFKRGRQR